MSRLKLSRLFCLLFALFVFFGSFGLSASAASDNLISPDLTTWQNVSNFEDNYFPITVTASNNIYRVNLNSQDGYVYYAGMIFDNTSIIAGHSYSLSFKMPTLSEINSAFNKSYSQSILNNHFENAVLTVGIGYLNSANEISYPENTKLYEITKDNYTNFFGKTLKASFVASTYTGTPCVYIGIGSLDGAYHTFYFSDFKLVDNDDNSAELTGIKGFLHSIRWDLVGGTCEEEDCPHSSGDNPHQSLTQRMSSGFSAMFQNIGDKFEEGSTLNLWFNNLSDTVGNLDGSLSNLGDRFQGFIDGLGESLSIDIDGFETSVTTWFDDLKKSWDQWIDDIENKAQEISDGFTEFFEKFKPRVAINFDWVRGTIVFDTGEFKPKDDNFDYVVVSDFFKVSGDTTYLLDYVCTSDVSPLVIFQYDLEGNFIGHLKIYTKSITGYQLPSGYQYRFRTSYPKGLTDLDSVNDYVIVYADEGWMNALLLNLKISLKGLFIPDAQFIQTWKSELELLLQERLGIIWDAGDFFIALIQTIGDLLTTTADDIHYELPEMVIELNGQTYTLWQAQQVDFSFLEKNAFFAMLYKLYKAVLNVLLGIPLLNYAKKEMDATLHN